MKQAIVTIETHQWQQIHHISTFIPGTWPYGELNKRNTIMIRIAPILLSCLLIATTQLYAQTVKLEPARLEPVQVSMSIEQIKGKQAVKVVKDASVEKFDEPTFVRIKGVDFENGTIEVKVLSRLLKDAPDFARGFIGIAFRINEDNSRYESIYIRPTNGRADDQVRRNHSIQYYAYPDGLLLDL